MDRIHHAHQHAIEISSLVVTIVHATFIVLMDVMDRVSIHCVPVSLQHFQQQPQQLPQHLQLKQLPQQQLLQ